tara:strand:- start:381 stop:1130 length:750 start_codon:yes stop_codon:yes gene_type:complete
MKKNFNKTQHFIFGLNNSIEIFKSNKINIQSIHLLKDGLAIKNKSIKIHLDDHKQICRIYDKNKFKKIFPSMRTQGIVIKFNFSLINQLPKFKNDNTCLLLPESIEDPQNLGQIIRTSECAGIDGMLISKNRSVGLTNTVLQVSQGAFLNLPLYNIGNINQTLNTLKKEGFWIIGVENSIDAVNWFDIDYKGKVVLVFGSEGKGIREKTIKNCDSLVTIPMLGSINSLNVSATVSAILFERNRQLQNNK